MSTVQNIREMSVDELESAQKAMLYPWEVEAWEKGELVIDGTSFRSGLMDCLDKWICEKQLARLATGDFPKDGV